MVAFSGLNLLFYSLCLAYTTCVLSLYPFAMSRGLCVSGHLKRGLALHRGYGSTGHGMGSYGSSHCFIRSHYGHQLAPGRLPWQNSWSIHGPWLHLPVHGSTPGSITRSYGTFRDDLAVLLPEKYDRNSCKLIITAGVGGAEACDWCKMLSRMYKKFVSSYSMPSETKYGPLPESLKYVQVAQVPGDLNGYKMVEVDIMGQYAYKLLKGEKGTHRLVRQTPFNTSKKRQTTFGGVQVIPILLEDDEDLEFYKRNKSLQDKDLVFESMRSEGKGGQNVNKVETAGKNE